MTHQCPFLHLSISYEYLQVYHYNIALIFFFGFIIPNDTIDMINRKGFPLCMVMDTGYRGKFSRIEPTI